MKLAFPVASGVALAVCVAGCGAASTTTAGGSSPTGVTSVPGATASNPAPPAPRVAPNDSFQGEIAHATGRFSRARDELTISLQPGTGASVRRVRITFSGSLCAAKPRCLELAGALTGELTEAHTIPDRGRTFSVAVAGALSPLGRVSGTGVVTGVGNARFGRESLRLTLTGGGGSVLLSGQSRELPAFSAP